MMRADRHWTVFVQQGLVLAVTVLRVLDVMDLVEASMDNKPAVDQAEMQYTLNESGAVVDHCIAALKESSL